MEVRSDERVDKPSIVILGAGYGGIVTTVNLQKLLGSTEADITLINKQDYHCQASWLHESAAGTIHHDRTRIEINDIVDLSKVKFIKDTVTSIQPEEKIVHLVNGQITYDILVIALGYKAETFGIPGLKEHALTIDNINNARLIREHIEYNFAMFQSEEEKKEGRLNIVVGGGGFTGLEFIGELANRIPALCKEFDIDKEDIRLMLIDQSPNILPHIDEELSDYAINSLEARGVEIITAATIKECQEDYIIYEQDGKSVKVPTLSMIWASSMRANPIVEASGFMTKYGKVEVRTDGRAPDYDNVFVVGDCALFKNEETNRPLPATAQITIQAADTISHNIVSFVRGEPLEGFKPKQTGTVTSLGSNDAIGKVNGHWKLYGWKATAMKKLIDNRYLYKLGGLHLLVNKGKFNFFY